MYQIYQTLPNAQARKNARKALKILYEAIPETEGCSENIAKDGGCGAWCCLTQTPQVFFSEFLNTWNAVKNQWPDSKINELFLRSVANYFNSSPTKGCVFWDKETKGCTQHLTRPYNCFLPDTLVYTRRGPRYIGEILPGDLVLTNDGTYQRVLRTMGHIHDGPIFSIRPQGSTVASWSTGDHKWLVSRQKDKRKKPDPTYVETTALKTKSSKREGDYLVFPRAGANEPEHKTLLTWHYVDGVTSGERLLPFTSEVPDWKAQQSIPSRLDVDDELLFVLGIYLAEGYSSEQSTFFCMNVHERVHLERVATWLERQHIRWHWSRNTAKSNLVLRVDSCLFARMMKKLCGSLAHNKQICPELFAALSNNQLLKVFEGYYLGDGRKCQEHVARSISTKSKRLAAQVCQILLVNDLYPRFRIAHNAQDGRISYDVILNHSSFSAWHAKPGQGGKVMYDNNAAYVPLAEIEEKCYCGPVIDIEVEHNHCFVTASGVAHNCRTYGQIPNDEFQPRYEKLKVLYPDADIRPQCSLLKTHGTPPSQEDMNQWFRELMVIEYDMGVDRKLIHGEAGGTYRTYHDHILLMFAPAAVIMEMNDLRNGGTEEEKAKFMADLRKKLEDGSS